MLFFSINFSLHVYNVYIGVKCNTKVITAWISLKFSIKYEQKLFLSSLYKLQQFATFFQRSRKLQSFYGSLQNYYCRFFCSIVWVSLEFSRSVTGYLQYWYGIETSMCWSELTLRSQHAPTLYLTHLGYTVSQSELGFL